MIRILADAIKGSEDAIGSVQGDLCGFLELRPEGGPADWSDRTLASRP
ncbi:hypothetical protein MKK55_14425 [Methylobacterium sp. J-059]|nr:hypothetical protein [Methylobacterium sp. J-059]MCJ2040126.1 hypothetical protein [Methylobacterium sp. J-059]